MLLSAISSILIWHVGAQEVSVDMLILVLGLPFGKQVRRVFPGPGVLQVAVFPPVNHSFGLG